MLDLVDVKSDKKWTECSRDGKVVILEVLRDFWVMSLKPLLHNVNQLHKLRHLFRVNPPPVVPVQKVIKTPKAFLFLLDMH